MSEKKPTAFKIAYYNFYVLAIVSIAFGSMYFFRSDIMPYHYAFLGINEAELMQFNPRLLELMTIFMKIIGSSYIGIGIANIFINAIGVRKEKTWSWWALLSIYICPLSVTYIITLIVSKGIEAGPKPPSYLALGMIVILVLGLALSFKPLLLKKG